MKLQAMIYGIDIEKNPFILWMGLRKRKQRSRGLSLVKVILKHYKWSCFSGLFFYDIHNQEGNNIGIDILHIKYVIEKLCF